jgi:RNA polymerase sigma-70 factor (ECF subfamily)
MHKNTEIYCIQQVQKGDKQAFSWIMDKYKDVVYTMCIRILNSEEDAREAAQDVFVKVYKSINNYQGKSKLSTWIYRIAYNHSISVLRKKVKMIDLVDDFPDYAIDENSLDALNELKDEERKFYLQSALETLPETDALVITLFYYEELSIEEITEITGLSSSNVRVRLHRSRQKIYSELSRQLKTEINSIL